MSATVTRQHHFVHAIDKIDQQLTALEPLLDVPGYEDLYFFFDELLWDYIFALGKVNQEFLSTDGVIYADEGIPTAPNVPHEVIL